MTNGRALDELDFLAKFSLEDDGFKVEVKKGLKPQFSIFLGVRLGFQNNNIEFVYEEDMSLGKGFSIFKTPEGGLFIFLTNLDIDDVFVMNEIWINTFFEQRLSSLNKPSKDNTDGSAADLQNNVN